LNAFHGHISDPALIQAIRGAELTKSPVKPLVESLLAVAQCIKLFFSQLKKFLIGYLKLTFIRYKAA